MGRWVQRRIFCLDEILVRCRVHNIRAKGESVKRNKIFGRPKLSLNGKMSSGIMPGTESKHPDSAGRPLKIKTNI